MDLNIAWFGLVWLLIAGYAVLDGFDLGVGVLHFFSKSDREKQINMRAIGPVWDGNEVWLLTAGGSLFAAFPPVYATVFSGFYLALMLVLLGLILRAVSLEFRNQVDGNGWRRVWDWSFAIGSLIPSIVFGVAVGNILRGLPIDESGTLNVSFLALLNPYAVLVGVLSLVLFLMHGAAYMAIKTSGELQERMTRWVSGMWIVFVVVYLVATIATFFVSPFLLSGVLGLPLFWVFFLLLLAGIFYIPIASKSGKHLQALLASSLTIVAMVGLTAVSLFPRMVPSSIDLANSLTIYNSSSTPRTLTVMLIIAGIGVPLMLVYTAMIYHVFRGKVDTAEEGY